jgi:competence protein ComEA
MVSALESKNNVALAVDQQLITAAEERPLTSTANVFVHVSGEVINPGIYQLPANSRLFDAVFAAGGFTEQAQADSVNLARPINDGEQIKVAKIGEISVQSDQSQSTISLNSATLNQLDQLPGIGATLAQRIIDWREQNGGFSRISDLRKVSGIGPKLYESIKTLVVP